MVPFFVLLQGGFHSWFSYKGWLVPFLVLLQGGFNYKFSFKKGSILSSPTRSVLFQS